MLTKTQKIEVVQEVSDILKNSANFIFVDFTGLKMSELTQLKKYLKKEGAVFRVIKKSLLEAALKESDGPKFDFSDHKGSVAVVYGAHNPDKIAQLVYSFGAKHSQKKPEILAGFLAGELMAKDRVVFLAQLPPREVLLTQVVQLLMSPVSGLVRVLDGISRK